MARAPQRQNHETFTFQRGPVYWVRLHSPVGTHKDGSKVTGALVRSLRTRDPEQAKILAAPFIQAHRLALQAVRPRFDTVWEHTYEPGRVHMVDGGPGRGLVQVVAGDRELTYINADGTTTRAPNGCEMRREALSGIAINPLHAFPTKPPALVEAWSERAVAPIKSADDAIFAAYSGRLQGFNRLEAESVWATFKTVTENKPLKDCTRKDAGKLVAHFTAAGKSSGTIRKKLSWLKSACNLAILEGDLEFNPFLKVTPKVVELERKKLDDDDIALIKGGFDKLALAPDDQLLVRLLACSGMRLSEAATIDHEETPEGGVRFVRVGTKNENSLRYVPLPADVLPFLPAKISGPLFKSKGASKRLNKFLRNIGIKDKAKVIHSLRHRAANRLLNADCPPDYREVLLGHRKSIAGKYAGSYPVAKLKVQIDKIGF